MADIDPLGTPGTKRDLASLVQVGNPITSAEQASAGFLSALGAAHDWVSDRHNWVRVVWFVAGYALTLVGLYQLTKPAIDATAGAVGSVAGKVAKGALL